MTYAGVCYDGPREGQHCESPYGSFKVDLWGYTGNYIPLTNAVDPATVRNGIYRWSHALRKWVFES